MRSAIEDEGVDEEVERRGSGPEQDFADRDVQMFAMKFFLTHRLYMTQTAGPCST